MAPDTLPFQLKAAKLTDTAMFALCYRLGGGVMTIGGVDQRIHLPFTPVSYAGTFTVKRLRAFVEMIHHDVSDQSFMSMMSMVVVGGAWFMMMSMMMSR